MQEKAEMTICDVSTLVDLMYDPSPDTSPARDLQKGRTGNAEKLLDKISEAFPKQCAKPRQLEQPQMKASKLPHKILS